MLDIHNVRTTVWKEIIKIKNNERWITTKQSLYDIHSLNFDGLLTPHEKFLRCVVKKLLSREIGDETRDVKNLFHKQAEYEESCPVHYSRYSCFHTFFVAVRA